LHDFPCRPQRGCAWTRRWPTRTHKGMDWSRFPGYLGLSQAALASELFELIGYAPASQSCSSYSAGAR
jgi:hypothetical protein